MSTIQTLPLILALNAASYPIGWINYEQCAYYYSKDKILWSLGKKDIVLRGGINAKTMKQSTLEMDTIVAIEGKNSKSFSKKSPLLTNKTLFERDKHVCAYCGGEYNYKILTRDHVFPTSRGGKNVWENCVTACTHCNNWKGDKTPEEADMKLLYVPYAPSYHEHLILQNRKILQDQMDFLMKGVSANSRLRN